MILSEPIIYPVNMYRLDDFDLQMNWRERCGATFDLTDYNARMKFWLSRTDREDLIIGITNPNPAGNGITLSDTSPNIWAHIVESSITWDPEVSGPPEPPPGWYVFELQTPPGPDPTIDGVWFRLAEGKVTYFV